MKKICLILIVLTIVCILVSCNGENIQFISNDTISYNGANYYRIDDDNQFHTHYQRLSNTDVFLDVNVPPSKLIGFDVEQGFIYLEWEDVLGDNVLMVHSWLWDRYSWYFKEGFEIPNYNEVPLDSIKILYEPKNPCVIELPDDQSITWNDIIDYETFILYDFKNNGQNWTWGDTQDYEDCFYTGMFWSIVVDDVAYIQTDPNARHKYYKIVDEYQQVFKDAINNSNK